MCVCMCIVGLWEECRLECIEKIATACGKHSQKVVRCRESLDVFRGNAGMG